MGCRHIVDCRSVPLHPLYKLNCPSWLAPEPAVMHKHCWLRQCRQYATVVQDRSNNDISELWLTKVKAAIDRFAE